MIEFHNVCAGYYGTEVLHNINVNLESGKVTVIVGPNGCGKSTLLKTLIRLNPHSSGEILVNGTKIEQSFLNNLYDCAILVDGALDIVEYLSKKYYLCTASNAPHYQQLHRLQITGIKPFIKQVFTSESLCADKPSKEFFDRCFEKIGNISPEQVVMIGDSLTADIEGGKNYGLKTIWYNHNKEQLPKVKIYDYLVNSLAEIKEIL